MKEREQHGHLPYAWQNWRELSALTQRFLELPEVQRALADDAYRLGVWPELPAGLYGENFGIAAEQLRRALNQTQKFLVESGDAAGLHPMTQGLEHMTLLMEGSTPRTKHSVEAFAMIPASQQRIRGVQVLAIGAVKAVLSITTGQLTDEPDRVVTEAHGLHAIVRMDRPELQVRLPRINTMATHDQLRDGYSYGNLVQQADYEIALQKRLLGARIRALQLDQYAREQVPNVPAWQTATATTLIAEVCTAKALEKMRPEFFAGQWGIGPRAKTTVNFSKTDLRGQLINCIPVLVESMLHYPPDAPLVERS